MSDFYSINNPKNFPEKPDYWTFSLFNIWRKCPQKWWLTNSKYSNVDMVPYPSKVVPQTIYGIVVHRAIEKFNRMLAAQGYPPVGSDKYKVVRKNFAVRNLMATLLQENFLLCSTNPRVKINYIKNNVSINECVNLFKKLVSNCILGNDSLLISVNQQEYEFHKSHYELLPSVGAENMVKVDEPPLKGIIDGYWLTPTGFVLKEFKTGMESEDHIKQVMFYSMLIWLKTGRTPEEICLEYPSTSIKVPLPSNHQLQELRNLVQGEIANFNEMIKNKNVSSNPSHENCKYCHVRQLCKTYWNSNKTSSLRLEHDGRINSNVENQIRIDVEVKFKKALPPEGFVQKIADGVRFIKIEVNEKYINTNLKSVRGCRILAARVKQNNNQIKIGADNGTEIFWIPG